MGEGVAGVRGDRGEGGQRGEAPRMFYKVLEASRDVTGHGACLKQNSRNSWRKQIQGHPREREREVYRTEMVN